MSNARLSQSEFQDDIDAIGGIDAVPMILDVVCRMTGMGFAAVARVTEHHWVACAVLDKIAFGLPPGGELPVQTTLCNEIRECGAPVVIDDVSADARYSGHPTPALYGFRSYISMPIWLADGRFFGTLCAIDPQPAQLTTPETFGAFKLFADLIGRHLDAGDRLSKAEASLRSERRTAELRDRFIAVLGHDLRNPLTAITSAASLLEHTERKAELRKLIAVITDSAVRMADLVKDVLDFARGQFGLGLDVQLGSPVDLAPVLAQVVEECRVGLPTGAIEARIAVPDQVQCDSARIAQALSNLLGNALTYGTEGAPIRVVAECHNSMFMMSVANEGNAIPAAVQERLFEPFSRGETIGHHQGLGLGLYIVAEIARAHGGTVELASSAIETRFTFSMPIAHPGAVV